AAVELIDAGAVLPAELKEVIGGDQPAVLDERSEPAGARADGQRIGLPGGADGERSAVHRVRAGGAGGVRGDVQRRSAAGADEHAVRHEHVRVRALVDDADAADAAGHSANQKVLADLQRRAGIGDVVGAGALRDGAAVATEDDRAFGFDPAAHLVDG